ncbi:hypothetical protein BS78_02G264500 [Paspalum vaginatum]|nr:hypothetical protein BS78_02G264500 [Paspalum vaginatum]
MGNKMVQALASLSDGVGGGGMKTEVEVEAEAKSLNLELCRLVLVPVDGNMHADGGRHWSLLVIHIDQDRSSCPFVHHDRLDGVSHSTSVKYAGVFRRVLPEAQPVIKGLTPLHLQQLNASDSGLYVLALTKAICSWWVNEGRSGKSSFCEEEVQSQVTAGHTDLDAMRGNLMQILMEEMPASASDPTN